MSTPAEVPPAPAASPEIAPPTVYAFVLQLILTFPTLAPLIVPVALLTLHVTPEGCVLTVTA